MNCLDTILSNGEIDVVAMELIKENFAFVDKKLKEKQIVFRDENAELIFTNHIVSLIKRILTQTFVDDIEESLMQEVSVEATELAKSLVEVLFTNNACLPNRSEVFLVATHMQLYLTGIKEEMNHE